MTETNTTSTGAGNTGVMNGPASHPAGNDQLLSLHKMSTTAGLGTQDYVAVNVTSVVAVVFGLASLLAIASLVLLVFPITGVILSWVAIRQIKNSNGTQTGRGLAIVGLVLSGIITAAIFAYQGIETLHRRSDQKAIAALCQNYGDLLVQKNYGAAYALFDSDFQNRWDKQKFVNQLTMIQRPGSYVPPIDAISWNGLAEFSSNDDGTETADSVMVTSYANRPDQGRMMARFKRVNDGPWLIDNIPDQFPAQRPTGSAQ